MVNYNLIADGKKEKQGRLEKEERKGIIRRKNRGDWQFLNLRKKEIRCYIYQYKLIGT